MTEHKRRSGGVTRTDRHPIVPSLLGREYVVETMGSAETVRSDTVNRHAPDYTSRSWAAQIASHGLAGVRIA